MMQLRNSRTGFYTALKTAVLVAVIVTPLAQGVRYKGPKFPDGDDDFFKHDLHDKKFPPQPTGDDCVLQEVTLGFALDQSSSISTGDFEIFTDAAAAFIREVTGNGNTFYVNFFSTDVLATSGPGDNLDDAQAAFVEAQGPPEALTNIAAALDDQVPNIADLPNPVAILVTDGNPTAGGSPERAADRVRDAGITLVTVGVGTGVDMDLLDTIASDNADGDPLSFQIDGFAQFADLLVDQVVRAIDSDGDGTPDCEDGCPMDPNKTDPGFCGCGVKDTFPCPGDLHGKGKKSFSKTVHE